MIRPGAEIAARHRRPLPDEHGARVPDARCERFCVAEQHEVLGRDRFRFLERRDDAAHRFVSVLGLRRELELREAAVAPGAEQHHYLGRPGRQIDGDVAGDRELRVVHVRAAGPDDLVHALDVREMADRLRAADRPHVLYAE